jgi:hypothetical protein
MTTVWLLIVTVGGVPLGAQYPTRDACEFDAMAVRLELDRRVPDFKIECVEREKVKR